MTREKKEYIPGVCNIGPAERRRRLLAGWLGLTVTSALFTFFAFAHAQPWWGLVLFLPGSGGAVGFLQAAFHFCAAFGLRGVFNVAGTTGTLTDVVQEESRRADRAVAIRIIVYAAIIGAATAGLGVTALFLIG